MVKPLAIVLLGLVAQIAPSRARGDHGDPMAARFWPQGTVSIETHWNLRIVVRPSNDDPLPPALDDADLILSLIPDQPGGVDVGLKSREAGEARIASERMTRVDLDHYLARYPNRARPAFEPASATSFVGKNAVHLSGRRDGWLELAVDGVRIAIPLAEFPSPPTNGPRIDAILLPGLSTADATRIAAARQWVEAMAPAWVAVPSTSTNGFPDALADRWERPVGNTMAISAAPRRRADASDGTRWVALSTEPWSAPEELASMLDGLAHGNANIQRVIAPLTARQMNYSPRLGLPPPRWNAELTRGYELLFFSQIYAAREPAIRPMAGTAEPMPAKYRPAHPRWDGREEARQLERVSAFTLRFAYLLDPLDLDQRAPGSFWTPRGLLERMRRNHGEHAANVARKLQMGSWP